VADAKGLPIRMFLSAGQTSDTIGARALLSSIPRTRRRHKIENMFARLKDLRRIATRYNRCPILFLSACALAATVIYWV